MSWKSLWSIFWCVWLPSTVVWGQASQPSDTAKPETTEVFPGGEPVQAERVLKARAQLQLLVRTRDQGINDSAASRVEPSTSMDLSFLRLFLQKEVSPRYRVSIRLNFLEHDVARAVEEAKLIYQPNLLFTVVAGKGQILQGGYESLGQDIGVDWTSLYYQHYFPFPQRFAPVVELHSQANGELTVQLTEDVSNADQGYPNRPFSYFSNVSKQPAVLVQWLAKFGKIVPVLQFGSYDLHHSSFFTGGVEFNFSGYRLSGDLSIDNRAEKSSQPGIDEPIALNHRIVNKVVQCEYRSHLKVIPFAKWTDFAVTQPTDQISTRFDLKANSTLTSWDDNQSSWQVGLHSLHWGEEFTPIIAYGEISGRFYRDGQTATIDHKVEKIVMVGVTGDF